MRTRLLKLKRKVTNRVSSGDEDAGWMQQPGFPFPTIEHLVATLRVRHDDYTACRIAVTNAYARERLRAVHVLTQALAAGPLRESLRLASPQLLDIMDRTRGPSLGRPHLSAFRYIARAATKATPFETLAGSVVLNSSDGEAFDPDATGWNVSLDLDLAISAVVYGSASSTMPHPLAALAMWNPSIRSHDDGTHTWHVPDYSFSLGTVWNTSRQRRGRIPEPVASLVREAGSCAFQLAAVVAALQDCGADAARAVALVGTLFEVGLLADVHGDDLLASRCEALARAGKPELRAMRSRLAAGSMLPHELDAARTDLHALMSATGAHVDPLWRPLRWTLYGNRYETALPPAQRELIGRVPDALARMLRRNPSYDALRALISQSGGKLGFEEFAQIAGRAIQDRSSWAKLVADGERLPPANEPQAVTAMLQFVDETLLVVNDVYEAIGFLTARLTRNDGDSGPLVQLLREWVKRAAGSALSLDITPSSDCNDLQAHAALTDIVLAWPGEAGLSAGKAYVRPSELRILIDSATFAITCEDAAGRRLSPRYLGAVYSLPTTSSPFLLLAMTQPWTLAHMHQGYVLAETPCAIVSTRERHMIARGVCGSRQGWRLRSAKVARCFQIDGGGSLAAVNALFEEHRLPHEFFARATGTHALARKGNDRKPQWFNLSSVVAVAAFRDLVLRSDELEITEPLPSVDQSSRAYGRAAEVQCEWLLSPPLVSATTERL